MTKFYHLLFVAFFFTNCRTATKSYNSGNYAAAIELGVKKLTKEPSDIETLQLVKQAYTLAVAQHESAVRQLSAGTDERRYEAIVNQYAALQELYETISQSPVASGAIQPANYTSYLATYRDRAASVYIETADRRMAEGNKRSYREAYNDYNKALRFTNNSDVRRKRDDAYSAALTRILIVPIRNYGNYSYSSSYQLQQFQSSVLRTLENRLQSDFVRFYTEWDLQNKNVEPDQVLEMNLGRISIGRPYDERSAREVSRQVITKETVYRPDSVVKQYATVRATITSTRRTLLSEGELYLTLRDVQGRILWNDRFTGQHRWETRFATYTGDERALSDSDKASLNQQQNGYNAPSDDDIMRELYQQIQSDLSYRLRGYFSRY